MRTDLFDFDLPPDRIALRPAQPRDAARLLVVRPGGAPELEDRVVRDLPDLLAPGRRAGGQRQQGDRGAAEGPADRPRRQRARDRGDPAQALDGSHWKAFILGAKKVQVGDTLRFGSEGQGLLPRPARCSSFT